MRQPSFYQHICQLTEYLSNEERFKYFKRDISEEEKSECYKLIATRIKEEIENSFMGSEITYEKLKQRCDSLSKEIDKLRNEFLENIDFEEYFQKWYDFFAINQHINFRYETINQMVRLLKTPIFSKKEKYGHKFSKKEFIECCESFSFMDSDGSGNYMLNGKESDITVHPTDITKGLGFDERFDAVNWYNK